MEQTSSPKKQRSPQKSRVRKSRKTRQQCKKVEWKGIKFASEFECEFAKYLTAQGLYWEYEPDLFYYVPKVKCYVPDFKIYKKDGSVYYLELKGYLDSTDRSKMRAIREQYPALDVRFVFQKPENIVNRKSIKPKTYTKWAESFGFKSSGSIIPKEWKQDCVYARKRKTS